MNLYSGIWFRIGTLEINSWLWGRDLYSWRQQMFRNSTTLTHKVRDRMLIVTMIMAGCRTNDGLVSCTYKRHYHPHTPPSPTTGRGRFPWYISLVNTLWNRTRYCTKSYWTKSFLYLFNQITNQVTIKNTKPLALGRCGCNIKLAIFKLLSGIDILSSSCKIAVRRMPHGVADDKSTLIQVIVWCQCWRSSLTPYGIIMSQ